MGVGKEVFVKACLKQPQLFHQKPETINNNVEETSKLLGIDKEEFIKIALRQPQLFCQKPETIVKKVRIIQYYKQINGTDSSKIVFSKYSAEEFIQYAEDYSMKNLGKQVFRFSTQKPYS